MICEICQKEIKDDSLFCVYCGTPINKQAQNSFGSSAQQIPTPGSQQVSQQQQVSSQPQMQPQPQFNPQQPPYGANGGPVGGPGKKPSNSNKPLLITIICLLAVLIIGVFVLIFVLGNKNNDGNEVASHSKTSEKDDEDDDDEDDDDSDDEDSSDKDLNEADAGSNDGVKTQSDSKDDTDTDTKTAAKVEETTTAATTEATTEESHIYPDDATGYNGHHYKVYYDSKTWQEAEDFCVSQGGHLISINSSTEQDFAVELSLGDESRYNVWCGGHLGDNGTWEWTDGSSFSYSNWDVWYYNDDGSYVLKPDNYTGTEFVIRFPNRTVEFEEWTTYVGKWDDSMNDPDLGTDTFCFICEWAE